MSLSTTKLKGKINSFQIIDSSEDSDELIRIAQTKTDAFLGELKTVIKEVIDRKSLILKNRNKKAIQFLEDKKKMVKLHENNIKTVDSLLDNDDGLNKLKAEIIYVDDTRALLNENMVKLCQTLEEKNKIIKMNEKILSTRKALFEIKQKENMQIATVLVKYKKRLESLNQVRAQTAGVIEKINLKNSFLNKTTNGFYKKTLTGRPQSQFNNYLNNTKRIYAISGHRILSTRDYIEPKLYDYKDYNKDSKDKIGFDNQTNTSSKYLGIETDQIDQMEPNEILVEKQRSVFCKNNERFSRREFVEMKAICDKIKNDIIKNTNKFFDIEKTFRSCLKYYHKLIINTQKVGKSGKGLKGSLLFKMQNVQFHSNNKFHNMAPLIKPSEKIVRPFAKIQDGEVCDVIYLTLKRMITENKNEFKNRELLETMPPKNIYQFNSVQVMGFISICPELSDQLFYEFEEKRRHLIVLLNKAKMIKY